MLLIKVHVRMWEHNGSDKVRGNQMGSAVNLQVESGTIIQANLVRDVISINSFILE